MKTSLDLEFTLEARPEELLGELSLSLGTETLYKDIRMPWHEIFRYELETTDVRDADYMDETAMAIHSWASKISERAQELREIEEKEQDKEDT